MEPLSLLPSHQTPASIPSSTPQPPTILLNMVLQEVIILLSMLQQEAIILPSMLQQEVIMPTTLLPVTMLPMAHMVVADTMPRMVAPMPTLHHMVATVETRTQPLPPQHMELPQQQITKREFVRMSGDFTWFYPLLCFPSVM